MATRPSWRLLVRTSSLRRMRSLPSAGRRRDEPLVELGPDILECDASWYVPVIARAQVFKEVAWRMVGGDVEGNPAAIGEVPHALEFWCRSRSTLACE